MPTSIIERARQVISADVDDYFEDETVLYYANQAKNKCVSYLINEEYKGPRPRDEQGRFTPHGSNRSLRALDNLRRRKNLEIDDTIKKIGLYHLSTVTLPEDVEKILHLRLGDSIILRELTFEKLNLLLRSNLRPSQEEAYYYIGSKIFVDEQEQEIDKKFFEVYTKNEPKDDIVLDYFKKFESLDIESTDLIDLPDRLINAVVYQTAVLMVTQENIREPAQNVETLMQIYLDEIRNNTY